MDAADKVIEFCTRSQDNLQREFEIALAKLAQDAIKRGLEPDRVLKAAEGLVDWEKNLHRSRQAKDRRT